MAYVRKNVWAHGGDFTDPVLLWYARGVKAMKARAITQPTAWSFYGAIHGVYPALWSQFGYPTTPAPTKANVKTFWKQCQHGSWYFLPWHRGYLIALEANIRAAIAGMPGAPSDWALPYWNYFLPHQSALPPAFATPHWPDGAGDNPLYVQQRYGPANNGNVFVPMDQVNLDALQHHHFTGPGTGASPGFGGVKTSFSHGGHTHGGVESQPHDMVHGLVGGGAPGDPNSPGLMSDPDTAALDPIFYLHHANIDRLWEVWLRSDPTHANPTDAKWLNGPTGAGGRAFAMPMPDGSTWTYKPSQMGDLSTLGYAYDDVSAPAAAPSRLAALGVAPAAITATEARTMSSQGTVELIGASAPNLPVAGAEFHAPVTMDAAAHGRMKASFARPADGATAGRAPDRVFLNLENIRGVSDATSFKVYVTLAPDGTEHFVGSVGLFGVRKASLVDEEHAGEGLTFVLEITKVVDAAHLAGTLEVGDLRVRLVPRNEVPDSAKITIGRISVFRHGA